MICSKWRSYVFIQVTMLLKGFTSSKHWCVISKRKYYKQVFSFLCYGARVFANPRMSDIKNFVNNAIDFLKSDRKLQKSAQIKESIEQNHKGIY